MASQELTDILSEVLTRGSFRLDADTLWDAAKDMAHMLDRGCYPQGPWSWGVVTFVALATFRFKRPVVV